MKISLTLVSFARMDATFQKVNIYYKTNSLISTNLYYINMIRTTSESHCLKQYH